MPSAERLSVRPDRNLAPARFDGLGRKRPPGPQPRTGALRRARKPVVQRPPCNNVQRPASSDRSRSANSRRTDYRSYDGLPRPSMPWSERQRVRPDRNLAGRGRKRPPGPQPRTSKLRRARKPVVQSPTAQQRAAAGFSEQEADTQTATARITAGMPVRRPSKAVDAQGAD